MKTWKKVCLCVCTLILIAWIVCVWCFIYNEKKITKYSTYCWDKLRQELWEYVENVSMPNATVLDWVYIYTWSVSYEWVDYNFSCKVHDKDNVDLELDVKEWDVVEPQTIDDINEEENIADCIRYFDWCNRCTKQDDWERICTEEACEEYQEAYCEDELNINNILKNFIIKNDNCGDDSQMFVNFAILWTDKNNNWNTEYYLMVNWEWFKIDKRWNLGDTCWFGIPVTIELDKDNNLVRYEPAKDWGLYDNSIKEMFSDEAYKVLHDAKYKFIDDKTFLEQAEKYFGVTIIPENENKFECKFCDKLWYYNRTPEADEKLNQTNESHYDYVAQDNWKNTIYFGSDWTFEAKGSRDAGKWKWTFWKDENTIIVLNNNLDHVYNRYIIINQTEDSLNTIFEIIQRM